MVVLGSLDYVSEMDELLKIPALLQENQFIRQGSVQLWYQEFMQTVGNDTTVYNNIFPFRCFYLSHRIENLFLRYNGSFGKKMLKIFLLVL